MSDENVSSTGNVVKAGDSSPKAGVRFEQVLHPHQSRNELMDWFGGRTITVLHQPSFNPIVNGSDDTARDKWAENVQLDDEDPFLPVIAAAIDAESLSDLPSFDIADSDSHDSRQEADQEIGQSCAMEHLLVVVRGYHRLLLEGNLSVDFIFESRSVLPVIIQCLDHDLGASELIKEATSALLLAIKLLTSIADAIEMIGLHAALPPLMRLHNHPEARVRDQARICLNYLADTHDNELFQHFGNDYSAPTATSSQSTEELLRESLFGYNEMLWSDTMDNPPVDAILRAELLPLFVQCLTCYPQDHHIITYAAQALDKIANYSGPRTIEDAIDPLVQLLRHDQPTVHLDAAMCLGTMAAMSTDYRDRLLQLPVLGPLLEDIGRFLEDIRNPASMKPLFYATFHVGRLCLGDPSPAFHLVSPAMPCLEGIVNSKDIPYRTKYEAQLTLRLLDKIEKSNETSSGDRSE